MYTVQLATCHGKYVLYFGLIPLGSWNALSSNGFKTACISSYS